MTATRDETTAAERAAMRALFATGHYDETPDSFEWLSREAADVAHLVETFPDRAEEEVYALLADTGLHDETDPEGAACLRRDAARIAHTLNGDHT